MYKKMSNVTKRKISDLTLDEYIRLEHSFFYLEKLRQERTRLIFIFISSVIFTIGLTMWLFNMIKICHSDKLQCRAEATSVLGTIFVAAGFFLLAEPLLMNNRNFLQLKDHNVYKDEVYKLFTDSISNKPVF
jgi:hypothetical protein